VIVAIRHDMLNGRQHPVHREISYAPEIDEIFHLAILKEKIIPLFPAQELGSHSPEKIRAKIITDPLRQTYKLGQCFSPILTERD
jgi:hypothetical protein